MQSNYEIAEIVPEQPQFMDGDCCSSLLLPFPNPSIQNHHYPLLLHHHHHDLLHPHQPIQQDQYSHALLNFPVQYPSASTPFTHQFFQPWQRRKEETVRTNHQPHDLVRAPQLNFKLGLKENSTSSNTTAQFALGGDYLLGGSREQFHHFPEKQSHIVESKPKYCRQAQEFSTGNSVAADINVPKAENKRSSRVDMREMCKELECKYRLSDEHEAIYSLAKIGEADKTGSGSALTCENSPADVSFLAPSCDIPTGGAAILGAIHGSTEEEASIGEEPSMIRRLQSKKKRKRKTKVVLLSSMTHFFEGLAEKVMGHQDRLHGNFLEAIERIDKARREREEAWRREEAQAHNREAIARVHEQALASNREALIVSHIEKITGQRVELPSRNITPLLLKPDLVNVESLKQSMPSSDTLDTNRRWPRSEVEALIRVRISLELNFQEPGVNGPLWEEVSTLMASMGYKRSAKRCKEKWDNINKYFRKTKNSSAAKGSQQYWKTCSYFDQLDLLYSKTPHNDVSSSSSYCSKPLVDGHGTKWQSYMELLEVFSARKDFGVTQRTPSCGNFEIAEMGCSKLDFDGMFHGNVELGRGDHDRQKVNHVYDEDLEDEIEEEEDNINEED